MSNVVRIAEKLEIGHNMNYERKTFIKKSNRSVSWKVFDKSVCVIHLIDMSHIKTKMEFWVRSNPDVTVGMIGTKTAKYITDYITDQHAEMWTMMKRGDLVEDISVSGYRSEGRYIVDIDKDTKDLGVTRNGLIIRDLYRDYDIHGSVYPDMYTITEFRVGYFDNPDINDYLCGPEMKSYWHCELSPIALDTKRLRLDRLTKENVFHANHKLPDTDDSQGADSDYLYVVVKFKGIAYMIIRDFSNRYSVHDMKKELIRFIKMFKESNIFERYEHESDENIKRIALTEEVRIENVCRL
jgi:hypothetical protein